MQTTDNSLDSNAGLPRAVRAQINRVRELESQPKDPPAEMTPSSEPAPIVNQEVLPPQSDSAPPLEAPKPADPRHSDPAYWQQRFSVTQGMLEKERRERIQDQAEFDEKLNELRAQLRESQQPAQPVVAQQAAINLEQFFTPEQIDRYGQDELETMAQVAIRAGRETAQQAINEAMQPIREREEREQQTRESQAQAGFQDALAEAVPDYEAIDAMQSWRDWLAGVDDRTGLVRQEILTANVRRRNAAGVAAVFNAFKAEQAPAAEPPIAPQGGGGPADQTPPSNSARKASYSPAEIRDYYKRASIGKVSDQERLSFESWLQSTRARQPG